MREFYLRIQGLLRCLIFVCYARNSDMLEFDPRCPRLDCGAFTCAARDCHVIVKGLLNFVPIYSYLLFHI